MKKLIFVYLLIFCCFKAYVMNNFEMLLISPPSYLPESTIGMKDIGNRCSIEKKLGMTIAGSIVHYTIGYLFGRPDNTPKKCAECLARILSANEPYICEYSRVTEYYESDISCLESLHEKYEACKWMIDESMYIVNRYNPVSMLLPIIHALAIINENDDPETFHSLINGGWRKSKDILETLKSQNK